MIILNLRPCFHSEAKSFQPSFTKIDYIVDLVVRTLPYLFWKARAAIECDVVCYVLLRSV